MDRTTDEEPELLALVLRDDNLLMIPLDAVESSTFRAMGQRLADLLNALDGISNSYHCRGILYEEVPGFKQELICRLRNEGWKVEIGRGDKWVVRPTQKAVELCAAAEKKKRDREGLVNLLDRIM